MPPADSEPLPPWIHLGVLRRLLWSWGWKPYWFHCPGHRHTFRRVYGDERLAAGHPYVCRYCPAHVHRLDQGRHTDE